MSGPIIDGTGGRIGARVDSRHSLHVQSRSIPQAALKCVTGDVFLLGMPWFTVSTNGGRMIWMQFNDADKLLVLDSLYINYNGGDTNHNRACQVEFILGDTQPTTGTTPWAAGNTNAGSTNSLSATVRVWDGVTGDGMTGHTPGITSSRVILGQGRQEINVGGRMIVTPGTTMSVNFKPEEAGLVAFSGFFYLLDPEKDSQEG